MSDERTVTKVFMGKSDRRRKKSGVAVSGTRPCVLREYVYVNG
jgi:hypothetical protein